ncbi:phosphocholine-specific phospholipase C [Ferruginibacter sp.]
MDTRRSFLKKAGLLTGATGLLQGLPPTLQKALAIDPEPGSSFYDAEHIVFLMQENRSFDHTFGTLQGVRGYNDPRAIHLPNNNKVWLQTNKKGETFAPFHLDIRNSKITWMGGLPHSWSDQVDARNGGKMDKWLEVKTTGEPYEGMPMTMGYYTRADIPFYYALADAFTVCDHNFCSSLTGTTPNRLYFWSGTIREKMEAASEAKVWNQDADYGQGEVHWKTYPERLEENGISWKVYQNEIYSPVGLGEKQSWLDNFGDNPLEYFPHYHVRMTPEYIAYLPEQVRQLQEEIAAMQAKLPADGTDKKALNEIVERKKRLAALQEEQKIFTKENFDKLTAHQKNIHKKAFTNNRNDPHYHELETMQYADGNTTREINVPKGDVLHQFREDVKNGQLPTVSWLAAPEAFSDHPSAAWFGAWYTSEVIDILTQNPEVWKKTIFVLTYDENDGYFDHVPPFAAPNPYEANTGKVSAGIDSTVEFVRSSEQSSGKKYSRESNIGLGFRVPMVIASPWTRGGFVCSEVFDHTSSLQFLENFLEKKTGKKIQEENITAWRRTVCGDLSSAFRTYNNEKIGMPEFLEKEKFIQLIYNAKFKEAPGNFKALTAAEKTAINEGTLNALLPVQEKGTRAACALPYELYVNGTLGKDKKHFEISLQAGNTVFGASAAGCPFYVYAVNAKEQWLDVSRDYAVSAGDTLKDEWLVDKFENNIYHLKAYGPNGFFRAFKGHAADPLIDVQCDYERSKLNTKKLTGNIIFRITNRDTKAVTVELADNSYNTGKRSNTIAAGATSTVVMDLEKSFGWYDASIKIKGFEFFEQQFAGHVETGAISKTDPLMGGVI